MSNALGWLGIIVACLAIGMAPGLFLEWRRNRAARRVAEELGASEYGGLWFYAAGVATGSGASGVPAHDQPPRVPEDTP